MYALPLLSIPTVAFWILVFFGRRQVAPGIIKAFIGLWVSGLVIIAATGLHPGFFTAFQALLDVILIVIIFGGDIQIR